MGISRIHDTRHLGISTEMEYEYCMIGGWVHIIE